MTHNALVDRPNWRCCPCCGSGDLIRPLTSRLVCRACGFEFYFNAATAVVAIITDDLGRLLATVRAKDPAAGMLDLPGGFVDLGESAEQGLAREVMEELGQDLVSATYLCSEPNMYPYKGVVYTTVDLAFACRVRNTRGTVAADDVADIRWLCPSQIDPMQFGFESTRRILARYLSAGGWDARFRSP